MPSLVRTYFCGIFFYHCHWFAQYQLLLLQTHRLDYFHPLTHYLTSPTAPTILIKFRNFRDFCSFFPISSLFERHFLRICPFNVPFASTELFLTSTPFYSDTQTTLNVSLEHRIIFPAFISPYLFLHLQIPAIIGIFTQY